MDLDNCTTCEGRHPAPRDEECPFTAHRAPTTRRVTRQTRRTPSMSPPPPPKRGRGGRRGRGRGGRTAHQRDDSPAPPDAGQNQPDPPQTPEPPAPRAASMQPSVVIQPADKQAAAIQAISDQLARMQQEARNVQAAAARDREADRQEMIRRTTTARPTASVPTQGPSHTGPSTREQPHTTSRLPYPPYPTHLVEHNQLKWEDTATRNSIRATQLLIAKEETMQAKFLGIPDKHQTKAAKKKPPAKEESGKPCPAYQSNTCSHQKSHVVDGTNMLHYCQYCFSHGNHRFTHPQNTWNKRGGKA